MNFKDSYKSSVNEIHGDRALLHSILNGERQKKKFVFGFRPAYSVALAAMFVLTVTSIFFKTGIEDHIQTKEQPSVEDAISHDRTAIVSEEDDVSDTKDAKSYEYESGDSQKAVSDTDKKLPAETSREYLNKDFENRQAISSERESSVLEDAQTDMMPKTPDTENSDIADTDESDVSYDYIGEASHAPSVARHVTEDAAAYDGSESVAEINEHYSDNSDSSDIRSKVSGGGSSGGGGGSSSKAVSVYSESVSIAEYWSYLGANPISEIALSGDMKLSVPQSVTITKSGEKTVSDVLTVSGLSDDGNRGFTLAISKTNELGSYYPDAKLFAKGNIKYAIIINNMNNEEISAIINSLN